ncbi:MAG: TolC family protein, partial [Glaciimonas sp.]|nr:TolC family protein [Glaciimonas sp.]
MSAFLLAPHNRARLVRFASGCVCALVLGGCASFSGITQQSTMSDGHSIDGRTLENSAAMQAATINAAWPNTTWWQIYRDPQLDQLIQQAIAQSPTLKIAQARIRQANAMAGIANAATLPKIGASASLTLELFTGDGLYPPPLGGNWDWSN